MKKTLNKSGNQNQMSTFFELYYCSACGLGCTSRENAMITELHKTTMDFIIFT